jgi:plastocyanin
MRRIRWMAALGVLAAMVLALGACGSDDDEGGSGSGSGAQQEESSGGGGGGSGSGVGSGGSTVQISATDFKFDPANPNVKAGKVKFEMTNDGQAPHAIEIEGPSGEAETKTVQGGEKASVTADLSEPGTYTMYCPVGNHRQMGMEGEITADGGSASAGDEEKKNAKGGGSGVSGY